MPHDWMTAKEAAEYAKCSTATIYQLVKDKKLKFAKLTPKGRELRFRMEWIDQCFMRSARVKTTSAPAA